MMNLCIRAILPSSKDVMNGDGVNERILEDKKLRWTYLLTIQEPSLVDSTETSSYLLFLPISSCSEAENADLDWILNVS